MLFGLDGPEEVEKEDHFFITINLAKSYLNFERTKSHYEGYEII